MTESEPVLVLSASQPKTHKLTEMHVEFFIRFRCDA